MKLPITNDNIETWNGIIYCYIMAGLHSRESDMPYGQRMEFADLLSNELMRRWKIVSQVEELIERLSNDTTSEMADCNQYCINELDKLLYKGDTNI